MLQDESAPLRPRVGEGDDARVGPYRLIAQIGAGSIGRVFLAEHTRLGRSVALKMIRRRFAENKHVVSRFVAEARAVNRIHHENVVEVTDFLESADGKSCYVMELLEGQSLAELLSAQRILSLSRAIRIARQVASALVAVHAEGIIHRDLKPGNIFLVGEQEKVKLLDFGLAKLTALGDESLGHRTMHGAVLGTPDYMAPEQTLGLEVDRSADAFSFGVLLFELIAGRRPFTAPSMPELFDRLRSTPAPRLTGVPDVLADLVDACLAKDASARPATAEIEATLRELEERDWRRPWWIPLAIVACIAATIAVAISTIVLRPPPPAPIQIAPEVKPPIRPELEAPKTVRLEFTSIPTGAELSTEGQVLGKTPLSFDVARSEVSIPFELRFEGHAPAFRRIAPVRDAYLMVHLAAEPKAPSKPREARRRSPQRPNGPIDRAEILDPFAAGAR